MSINKRKTPALTYAIGIAIILLAWYLIVKIQHKPVEHQMDKNLLKQYEYKDTIPDSTKNH